VYYVPAADLNQPDDAAPGLTARSVAAAEFDSLVSNFDGVVQEMTVAFARSRWPKVEIEPWIFEHGGKAVAAALVMLQPYPLRLGHLAITKWGPILASEAGQDCSTIYQGTVSFLKKEYAHRRKCMLSIMARAEQEPSLREQEALSEFGFKSGAALAFPNRYLINVQLSDADQRKSFSQKWRYHLNKSEKNNLIFEVAPDTDIARFQKLYEAMSERKQFPDYSAYGTLESLYANLPAPLKPKLFFVTKDGVDVAGAVIFTAGKTAVYLYGATNEQALPLRAGYLMHAKIIAWLRDNTRASWYDLGGTDGYQGLHQFKKGMVGTAGRIVPVPPIHNFASSRRAKIIGTFAYQSRDAFQNLRRIVNLLRGKAVKPDQVADT
jgi:lipid II:glycine glycyltransferase (peptidoglycan interpeptide bridge formation enzyme)